MDIGIITHPLRGNYGGMLQAYALQETLTRMGHTVRIVDMRTTTDARGMKESLKQSVREKLAKLFLSLGWHNRFANPAYPARAMGKRFAARFTHLLPISAKQPPCDAYVVGSDQVWRCLYVRGYAGGVPFFFLKQASPAVRARSIAYAASFGTDTWEGTPEETAECASLLQDFKAVSVRESSGIELCRRHLNRTDAVRMPDPTLLATDEDYRRIMEAEGCRPGRTASPYCAHYLLDNNEAKQNILHAAARLAGLQEGPAMMARPDAPTRRGRLPMGGGRWLSELKHARLMITDSFHGCVFSIIFNKPFLCIMNEGRGVTRMQELLSTYGLENRLLPSSAGEADIAAALSTPIDWERVNGIRAAERERGLRFLRELDE